MHDLIFTNCLAQLFTRPTDMPTLIITQLWVLPICLSIALVYKAIKLEDFKPALYVREVILLFGTIVGFLIIVAAVLFLISRLVW
ncbi:MAG: hypothetical protein GY869_26235 [Planctomycetes bacterium]|nr:hypothetical protein [Planctomycetota bacterium]